MIQRGKNINLFLMDGNATGRIKCTLANWTGIAYKIPRTELDKCKERQELKQSGIYFLFGVSEQTGRGLVYIGQAGARKNGEGVLNRLFEHKRNAEKDYWTEAIVFVTANNSFGPTELCYLENRFVYLAIEANRYVIKNGNDPTPGNITEEKESELEEFIDYAKIIIGTLGHKIFIPLDEIKNNPFEVLCKTDNENIFYLNRKSKKSNITITASCKQTSEGFVVLKGSVIEVIDSSGVPASVKKRRSQALIDKKNILQRDELFNSPTYAAVFVVGGAANGLTEWKTKDGRTLKELESLE